MGWVETASRTGAIAALALFAQSCVPSEASTVTAAREHGRAFVVQDIPQDTTVAAAQPLLQKLDLHVAPADLPVGPMAALARPQGMSFLDAARSPDDAARATECMTAAIYYEARSEPVEGQRAVAQVVLNRVRDRAFPNSVCGVVYQGSERSTGCQFSFTCDGSLYRQRDTAAWERARTLAVAALSGDTDPAVGSATHYHATSIFPWWAPSLRRIGVIGHHAFYRWAAPLERALSFRQRYSGVETGGSSDEVIAAFNATEDPAAVETVAGVTIHRSGGAMPTAHGVTVHRGPQATAATSAAPVVATNAVAATPTPASGGDMHGVRVHRGDAPAVPDAAPTAG